VAQRNRFFWLKTLMVATLVILIGDVLALTCVVVPLAAPQEKRAKTPAFSARLTQSAMDQALILPTHDPRKPWVTRTPLPTATPWLIPSATLGPQRQATPGLARSATQIPANAFGAGGAPESSGGVASAVPSPPATTVTPVGTPRPTLSSPQVVGPVGSISPTSLLSADVRSVSMPGTAPVSVAEIVLTDTPTPAGILPTETLDTPASTPSPTRSQVTAQPPPPIVPGDEAQFTAYVMDRYGAIADQALDIVAINLDTAAAGALGVAVELSGDGASNVFAAQTAAAALDYGSRLLNDMKSYFSGQYYALAVASTYKTSSGDACIDNPTWCDLDTFDASANTWTVTWTYVRGTSIDGMDSVLTWNTGQ
jgi:hypothetical protein